MDRNVATVLFPTENEPLTEAEVAALLAESPPSGMLFTPSRPTPFSSPLSSPFRPLASSTPVQGTPLQGSFQSAGSPGTPGPMQAGAADRYTYQVTNPPLPFQIVTPGPTGNLPDGTFNTPPQREDRGHWSLYVTESGAPYHVWHPETPGSVDSGPITINGLTLEWPSGELPRLGPLRMDLPPGAVTETPVYNEQAPCKVRFLLNGQRYWIPASPGHGSPAGAPSTPASQVSSPGSPMMLANLNWDAFVNDISSDFLGFSTSGSGYSTPGETSKNDSAAATAQQHHWARQPWHSYYLYVPGLGMKYVPARPLQYLPHGPYLNVFAPSFQPNAGQVVVEPNAAAVGQQEAANANKTENVQNNQGDPKEPSTSGNAGGAPAPDSPIEVPSKGYTYAEFLWSSATLRVKVVLDDGSERVAVFSPLTGELTTALSTLGEYHPVDQARNYAKVAVAIQEHLETFKITLADQAFNRSALLTALNAAKLESATFFLKP